MKKVQRPDEKRFRAVVARLLELPIGADERAVRRVLRAKGSRYIKWYETRVSAIWNSRQHR
jgi:hypothetical protein